MAFADYDFYVSSFAKSVDTMLQESEFVHFERAAELELSLATLGRTKKISDENVPDDVRYCCCELAEFLAASDKVENAASENGSAGLLTHYSNDGQTGTFDTSASRYAGKNRDAEMYSIIRKHLAFTGLLNRSVMQV